MASSFTPARSDQGSFNVKELFFKYLRFLPLFIFSMIIAGGIAFLYLRYTTPVYKATGNLLLKDDRQQGGSSNDKFQELFIDDRSKNINNEMEYLRSRPLVERVVEELGLNYSIYAKGKIRQLNVYKLAPFVVDAVQMKDSVPFTMRLHFEDNNTFTIGTDKKLYAIGQNFKVGTNTFRLLRVNNKEVSNEYTVKWQPTASAARSIIPAVTIAPKIGGSGILVLSMETDNHILAADVINQLMEEYHEATIEDKNTTTKQTLNFLNGRLKLVQRELDSITNQINQYRAANNMGDIEAVSGSYYSKADEADNQLHELRQQLTSLFLIEEYVANSAHRYTTVASSFGLQDITLNNLINGYNAMQLERKQLIDASVPVTNPKVVEKEDQIEKLRINILENIRNIRRSYNATISSIQSKNTEVLARIRALPEKQQNLIEMKRQEESKLAVFNFLLEKREETSISLAATISNIKILEPAYPNETPVQPNHRNIYTLAILVGLIIPAIFILIKELLDDKILTREDIERQTSVTILGEIGHASAGETLVVTNKSRSFVAEQFRIVRSNLQYVLTSVKNPVILVTSSFSGEGKSFISTNIGAVMALAGKKTIILEFDLRKPKILSGLKMTKKPGLTNYLLGKIEVEQLPIPVEGHENLFVLACGPIPPNPAELLLEKKLHDLFAFLRANFDMVIMDTAPVGMVGDALTLSQFADTSIYIVRQGVTHKKQIELVDEYARDNKLPKVSIILNDIRLRAGYGYYGYGRYGYGYGRSYGFGDGYYDDEDKDASTFMQRWFGWTDRKSKKKQKV